MGLLHWDDATVRIKAFSSAGKPGSTIIKVELVTSNHTEAGWIMERLAQEQADAETRRKAASRRSPPVTRAAALPSPLLALPAPKGAING